MLCQFRPGYFRLGRLDQVVLGYFNLGHVRPDIVSLSNVSSS
jgi:hypothetical protein